MHIPFLGRTETSSLSQVRNKGPGTARPWLTSPGCLRLSPWNWSSRSNAAPGAPSQGKQSLPRHRLTLGQLAQAGQISSVTQSLHLPQLKHLFPRQTSLTPHCRLLGKGNKGEGARLERQVGMKAQPEENWEPRGTTKWESPYLNVYFRAPNTQNSAWHIINMNGFGGFL